MNENKNNQTFYTVLFCIAVLIICAAFAVHSVSYNKAQMAQATVPRDPATITVSGTGTVDVKADIGKFTISVESVQDTAESARIDVSSKINIAIDLLKEYIGVTDKDLETGWISIEPYYEWDMGSRTLVGQKAYQSINVTTASIDKAGRVYELLASIDGISVSSITLDKKDKSAERTEARKLAVEAASKKAQDYADALGIKIMGVMSVSGNSQNQASPYLSNFYKSAVYDMESASGSTEYYAGDISITENVNIVYSIY